MLILPQNSCYNRLMGNEEKKLVVPEKYRGIYQQVAYHIGEQVKKALTASGLINAEQEKSLTQTGADYLTTELHRGTIEWFTRMRTIVPLGGVFDEMEIVQKLIAGTGAAKAQINAEDPRRYDIKFTGGEPVIQYLTAMPLNPQEMEQKASEEGFVRPFVQLGAPRTLVGTHLIDNSPQFPAQNPSPAKHIK